MVVVGLMRGCLCWVASSQQHATAGLCAYMVHPCRAKHTLGPAGRLLVAGGAWLPGHPLTRTSCPRLRSSSALASMRRFRSSRVLSSHTCGHSSDPGQGYKWVRGSNSNGKHTASAASKLPSAPQGVSTCVCAEPLDLPSSCPLPTSPSQALQTCML